MLDPWIIDEIRRREQDRLREDEAVERLPCEVPSILPPEPEHHGEEGPGRGVVVVDYTL
jgi:hypothetical protein